MDIAFKSKKLTISLKIEGGLPDRLTRSWSRARIIGAPEGMGQYNVIIKKICFKLAY